MTTVENQYLVGNFAPVKDELTVAGLPVDGAIPSEINGRYLRNGPNPIAPDPAAYHWFTGDGMLHAVELRDGKAVSYRNRWVRTDQALDLLGEDPIPGQPEDVFPVGSSAANTHVVAHAGKIFALVEVCLPTQVRPDLSTVGRCDFGGKLRSAMTAHPKIDPVTGEMLFFGYDPFGPPWLRFHAVNAAGELVRSEDIDIRGPSMVHDFAITERNVVFLDLPVVFDFDLVGKRPFPAEWKPDYGARVGVPSVELSSTTTISSTRGRRRTRCLRMALTMGPIVGASLRAGSTTDTRRPRLASRRPSIQKSSWWNVRTRGEGTARRLTSRAL